MKSMKPVSPESVEGWKLGNSENWKLENWKLKELSSSLGLIDELDGNTSSTGVIGAMVLGENEGYITYMIYQSTSPTFFCQLSLS